MTNAALAEVFSKARHNMDKEDFSIPSITMAVVSTVQRSVSKSK